MKGIFTALLTCGLGWAGLNAQVINDNFDNWTANSPDGWMGTVSNINADSVSQVSGQSDYGMYAVELRNASPNHKRFSSEAVSVTSGEAYTVEFWIKGTGEIRSGLFDGSAASAFTYNSYLTVDDAVWTKYSQVVTADTTTMEAEIIFSLRNTSLLTPIMIDSVSVYNEALSTTSIYDIQYTADVSGDSPYMDQVVMTSGVVTATSNAGYYIADGTGAYSGVYVYDNNNTPSIGDEVNITATVVEYYNLTELNNVAAFEVVSSGNAVSANMVTAAEVNSEAYEGVLVQVGGTCTNTNLGFGMWELTDSNTDACNIDDLLFSFTPTQGQFYAVTGVVDFSFDEYKVLPRDANDIAMTFSIEDQAMNFTYTLTSNQVIFSQNVDHAAVLTLEGKKVADLNNVQSIQLDELSTGIYLVVVQNNGQINSFKIIK